MPNRHICILTFFYLRNTKERKNPPSVRNISTEIKPDSISKKNGFVITEFKFYMLVIPALIKNEYV